MVVVVVASCGVAVIGSRLLLLAVPLMLRLSVISATSDRASKCEVFWGKLKQQNLELGSLKTVTNFEDCEPTDFRGRQVTNVSEAQQPETFPTEARPEWNRTPGGISRRFTAKLTSPTTRYDRRLKVRNGKDGDKC